MKFLTTLKFLVASEALRVMYIRVGVHAQSVVVDRTSDTNVADAAVSDVLLETLPADSGGRFFPTGINNLRVVSRRNLAAANSNEGSTEDFDALTERKKEAEPADLFQANSFEPFCVIEDYPCGPNNDMVYVCHYSVRDGYKTFCVPEADSDALRFYPKDYCGQCVGIIDGANFLAKLKGYDPVTRGDDGPSSTTSTMHHTVADVTVSDILLETLPADSGGRFSSSNINNNLHHDVVDPVTRGDGSSSKTSTKHHSVADAGVLDVLLETDVSSVPTDTPSDSFIDVTLYAASDASGVSSGRRRMDDRKVGFRMNFLTTPKTRLMPNLEMDVSGLEAAREFVDELVTLGVFCEIDDGLQILANAPLFVVPKPGQPGKWRCIADMKKGGQNDCIGSDPCFLPRTGHILEEMYAGGYSAVVDLSKYFHNFPTHKDDRPYLGMIHPVTGVLLAYFGLPMGSSNSPATSGRAGNSFMRKLREDFRHVFSGVGNANCYWTKFQDLGYDPDRGYGFVLTNKHGLAVKLWGFVDDFLIHASSLELVTAALTIFLDFAVVVESSSNTDRY